MLSVSLTFSLFQLLLFQVIHSLHDHFHPGTDFCGIPWILIIIVFLGISTLAIFLWKTNLCVSFLKTVLKSRNVHDRSTDVHRRAWRSNSHSQEGQRSTRMHTKKRVSSFPGIKIGMEDLYTSRRYMEAKVRTEVHKVMTKVNSHYKINGQRKTPKEEKLRMKECEQAEKDRQLSEAEENGKSIMKEIDTYMKLFHAAERLRRRAEDYYRRKIAPSARKPHANWLCAQALQRKMAERKAASKQQRCEMREKQRVPERHMSREPVQGQPGLENPFWRADSGLHSVPMRNSSCIPAENREKTKLIIIGGTSRIHKSSGAGAEGLLLFCFQK
ncbi:putative NPIP-like protein [Nomascus leucogenys]|uniref:putative NPIP-like protein n=1 Tax=Nomascus leucogenys TaxID=61853 RepID=UPI00122D54AB|nr:putative NPIP-like protein [Nomascus leucogenys]